MIVYSTLLTATPDPQRGTVWDPDPTLVADLAASVARHGHRLVVFSDSDIDGWVRVQRRHPNPYFDRWNIYRDHLAATGQVWCVDATDVELLHDPPAVELACGSECDRIGWPWLLANHPTASTLRRPRHLLNAGIVGGEASRVRDVAAAVAALANDDDLTDMAAFNRALQGRSHLTGPPVHTRFRVNDRTHPTAWWRHK